MGNFQKILKLDEMAFLNLLYSGNSIFINITGFGGRLSNRIKG